MGFSCCNDCCLVRGSVPHKPRPVLQWPGGTARPGRAVSPQHPTTVPHNGPPQRLLLVARGPVPSPSCPILSPSPPVLSPSPPVLSHPPAPGWNGQVSGHGDGEKSRGGGALAAFLVPKESRRDQSLTVEILKLLSVVEKVVFSVAVA